MFQNSDENRKLSSVYPIQPTWMWSWVGTCQLVTHVVVSGLALQGC